VTIAFPIDAYRFESGVGKRRGETGVSATDFDGTCSLSFFPDIHSEPDELALVLVVRDWLFCWGFRFGAFLVCFLSWGCPPEVLEGGRAGPHVAVTWFGFEWINS